MSLSPDSSKPLPVEESPNGIDWCCTQIQVDTYLYKWSITNFNFCCSREIIESSEFPIDPNAKTKWRLRLYPSGFSAGGFASLYLQMVSQLESVPVVMKMSLLTETTEKYGTKKLGPLHVGPSKLEGFQKFIELNDLNCKANGLLPNNTLTILCELSVWSDNKTTTGQSKTTIPKCCLSEDLANLLLDAESADVTLAVDEHEITAHKVMLCARSQVFAAMFKHQMEESKLSRVIINDMLPGVVEEMLHFIYTGKSPYLDQMPGELLAAADKYDLKTLKSMCEQELLVKMSSENAGETLILADRHNARQLKLQTINFINANASAVLATSGWKNLKKSHLFLIAEAYVSMKSEQHILI